MSGKAAALKERIRKLPLPRSEKSHDNDDDDGSLPELKAPLNSVTYYAITPEQCSLYAGEMLKLTGESTAFSLWGFDAEWRVEFGRQREYIPHKVALLQFYRNNTFILFHIHACGIQPELVEVLKHPRIFKVGLNIRNDVLKLSRDFVFLQNQIFGVVDCRQVAKHLHIPHASSLAGMVEQFCGCLLPKPSRIRCGNWEIVPLSFAAKKYAALDAFASFIVMKCVVDIHLESLAKENLPDSYSAFVLSLLVKLSNTVEAIAPDASPSAKLETNDVFVENHNDKVGVIGAEVHRSTLHYLELYDNQPETPSYSSSLPALSESKKSCCHLFGQGKAIEDIARIRMIKEGTVTSYLLAGLESGIRYNFRNFNLPLVSMQIILVSFLSFYGRNLSVEVDVSFILKDLTHRLGHQAIEYWQVKLLKVHLHRALGALWLQRVHEVNESFLLGKDDEKKNAKADLFASDLSCELISLL